MYSSLFICIKNYITTESRKRTFFLHNCANFTRNMRTSKLSQKKSTFVHIAESILPPTSFFNLYPPFYFTGISVTHINKARSYIKVQLKSRWYSRNYMNVHFGGTLMMMCDSFFMFILVHQLGDKYLIWDKATKVEYMKAVKETLYVEFQIPPEKIESIRQEVDEKRKIEIPFCVNVVTKQGEIAMKFERTIYIRKKRQKREKNT